MHLLNKFIAISGEFLPTGSHLRELRFRQLGKGVQEKYGCANDLKPKPEGVGLLSELPTRRKASWDEVFLKTQNDINEMVQQAATYARCSLLDDLRRFFALGIGFNHRSLET
jgi:hypothetical protein